MKKSFLLLALFSLCLIVNAQQSNVPATDPSIEYVGRFDFKVPSSPAFMYSGCMIRTGFTGTSISIKLEDDSLRNWFTVRLDDSLFTFKLNNANGVYLLGKNLHNRK